MRINKVFALVLVCFLGVILVTTSFLYTLTVSEDSTRQADSIRQAIRDVEKSTLELLEREYQFYVGEIEHFTDILQKPEEYEKLKREVFPPIESNFSHALLAYNQREPITERLKELGSSLEKLNRHVSQLRREVFKLIDPSAVEV